MRRRRQGALRLLAFVGGGLALGGCGQSRTQSGVRADAYSGTVVVGHDYVQVLATAAGFDGCPPRTQSAGQCVRTPPKNSSCDPAKQCITALEIKGDGPAEKARSEGPFAQVPWLASTTSTALLIEVTGCGGAATLSVPITASVAPFEQASASLDDEGISFRWSVAKPADQVCGLWRWPKGIEVCCAGDTGSASFSAPAETTDARLSRGRELSQEGGLRVYRTRETENLLTR